MSPRTRLIASLGAALLGLGCEGSFGFRGANGGGTPRLLGTRDVGVPSDAWVAPGVDARVPDASVTHTPDAFVVMPDAAMPTPGCGTPTEQAQLELTNGARAPSARA